MTNQLIAEHAGMGQHIYDLEKSGDEYRGTNDALKLTKEMYRSIFENAPIGIFISTPDGRYLSANPALAKMYGFSSTEELLTFTADIGRQLYVNPEDRIRLKEVLGQKGFVEEFVTQQHHRDGCVIWTSSNVRAVYGPDGKILHYEGTVQDITARRKAEETLVESEERYRIAIENSNDGVAIMRGTTHIFVNRKFVEMFGYDDPVEIIGKTTSVTVHPDDYAMVHGYNITRQKGESVPQRYEFKGVRKDGTLIYIEASAANIMYQGNPSSLACLRDISSRKTFEQTLQAKHRQLLDIIEFFPDPTFVIDKDKRVIAWNRALEDMTGVNKKEMLGKSDNEYSVPFYGARRPMLIDLILQPDQEVEKSYDFVRRKGNVLYAEGVIPFAIQEKGAYFWGTASQLLDNSGSVSGAIESVRDITDQKAAAKALRENEEKYRAIFENSVMGIFQTTPDGKYLSANPELARMFGYQSPDELLAAITDIEKELYVHPEDTTRLKKQYEEHGLVQRFETQICRKDGTKIWISMNARAVRGQDGKIFCYEGTTEDITERKRAEEALRESEKKFRDIAELAPQMIFEIDIDGRLTYANRETFKVFDRTEEEYRSGIDIYSLFVPDELPRLRLNMQKIIEQGFSKGNEYTMIGKEGGNVPVLAYSAPLYKDGELSGFRGVLINIAERKNLEAQLLQAQKMESIGTLAGGIAHDFNNLLTTILGCGQLLKMKADLDGRSGDYVDRIIEAAESAAQLTRNILAFSRKQPTRATVVNVNRILEKIERMALRTVQENIELQVLPSRGDLNISADASQLEQILMNLIVNARDAMPGGGRLTIRAEQTYLDEEFIERRGGVKPGRYVKIAVTDDGVGMDMTTVERIFEPFFTTKEVGKGTGLGLSVTHGIVKKHDGFITVSSSPGKGTTFKVYLPLTNTVGEVLMATPYATCLQKGDKTILIAEDNPLMLNMLKTILKEGGYEVIEAVDGEDALQKYIHNRERIEMVILDMIMPKKNGTDVYGEIRKFDPFQKMLLMSGYAQEDMNRQGNFHENLDYLSKPFLPDRLLTKIQEIFSR